MEQSYNFGGHLVGIRTTSEAFGAWLAETLGKYRVKDEAPVHYSVVVEEGQARKGERRFHILYGGTVTLVRTRDVSMLGRRLLSELELSLLDGRDDLIFVEAAPVTANGVTVLVPVILVSYVTSLGRLLERVGLSLPAHAFVAIDPERGTIVPTPPVLVNVEEAVRGLATLFPPDDASDSRLVIDRPWPIDVVCSIGQGEPGIVEPVSRATALHRLTKYVVNLKELQGTALHGLERLVSSAQCRQVSTAGPRNVVEAIVAETRALDGA